MPIGAVIGAAAIGGAATYAGSKKNSKAINKASSVQAQSEADQTALQRETYAQNTANLSPFMARGNAAGNEINALLGLGGSAQVPAGALSPFGTQNTPQSALGTPYDAAKNWYSAGGPPLDYGATPQTTQTVGQQQQNPAQSAADAYEIFKQSTGYGTRLAEGNRSLASNYFGGGVGQSGAAVKAALKYGQNFASNEFGNYMGYLGNQQGVGLSGASALAGVSQNFANNMGNISQNNANTQSQAAIARAQNNGALYTGLAGIAGQTAGALSSYRAPQFNYAALTPDVNATFAANPGIF